MQLNVLLFTSIYRDFLFSNYYSFPFIWFIYIPYFDI